MLMDSSYYDAYINAEPDYYPRRGRDDIVYRQAKMTDSKPLLSKYWSDFLDKKQLNSSLQPATAVTRQFELHSPELQEQFLFNNGTEDSLLQVQNFYINPFFAGRTTYLEPGQDFKFFDLVVFEPKVLQTTQAEPLQMTLYVKTGTSVL